MTDELIKQLEKFLDDAKILQSLKNEAVGEEYVQYYLEFEELEFFHSQLPITESKVAGIRQMVQLSSNNQVTLSNDLITKIIIYANS